MHPKRAAWFFAAGIAWLALRGILVQAFPQLRADQIAQHGGLFLIVPLVSVVASLTAPVFFLSFLRGHRFTQQPVLKGVTILALTASVVSSALVLMSFVAAARGAVAAETPLVLSSPWLFQTIPLVFVGSLLLFLVVFARQSGCNASLRRAAGVAAVGAVIPMVMIAAWVLHSRFEGAFLWVPSFSQSLGAKVLGLAAAGSLLWFLEAFAVGYDDGGSPDQG